MFPQFKKVISITVVLLILFQCTTSTDLCSANECSLSGNCISTDLYTQLKKDSSGDGLCICVTESMCITSEYHCVKPSIKAIRKSDTRECIDSCPSGCLNKITLACIPTDSLIDSNENDGLCECTGSGCFNPYTNTCLSNCSVLDSDSDNFCRCIDNNKCASDDAFTSCVSPAVLSNGPNLKCSTETFCEDDSKCFNPVTKVCIEVTGELRKKADGSCECKVSFHCFDGANDTCTAPLLTILSENNHYDCKAAGTVCDTTTDTCFYLEGIDKVCYKVAASNNLVATSGEACACANPLHVLQANHQLKTEMKCVEPTSYPLKSTLKDHCQSQTFYSLLYGMYLPTLSDGEVNENGSCRCKTGLINVSSLDNSIFCGCPDNKYYDTVNNTCKTLEECNTAGLVALDSYCVPCPGAPEFPLSTTEFNKCTCPNWRPNICADIPVDGESTGLVNYNNGSLNEISCQRNAISTNIYVNFDKTSTIRYDFPLTANMTIYVQGCRMYGRNFITPKLYFKSVNLADNGLYIVDNINCGFGSYSRTIAYKVAQSGLYTLELTSSVSYSNGFININLEIPIESISFSAELTSNKTQNAIRNSIIVGLSEDNDIFNDKYDHMFKELKEGDVITVHRFTQVAGDTSESFIRIRNLADTFEVNDSIANKQIYRYVVAYPDDYVIHIGCKLDTNCANIQYNVNVDKLDQKNLRKVHQEKFLFTYIRDQVPTNDAKTNAYYLGKVVSGNSKNDKDYLFKSMSIFDSLLIKVNGKNSKARILVKDLINPALEQDLEVASYKDVRDVNGITKIYSLVVRIPGDYIIQFGCVAQSFPCTANVEITVRRTLVQYIPGTLELSFDESYAQTVLGEESSKPGENLINNTVSFNLYSFMFPTLSTKEVSNEISLTVYGYYTNTYRTISNGYTDIMPLYNLETVFNAQNTISESLTGTRPSSYKLDLKCSDVVNELCHYNYYTVRYIPPTPAGFDTSNKKCVFCLPTSISLDNKCTTCNSIFDKNETIPVLYRVPGTNNCENYKKYIFNPVTKKYDCDTANGYTTANCICTGTEVIEVKNLNTGTTMCTKLTSPSFKDFYEIFDGSVSPIGVLPKLIEDTNPPHTLGYQVICYLALKLPTKTHIIGYSNFDTITKAKKFFWEITNKHVVIDKGVQTFSRSLQDLYDGFDESKAVCVLRRITEDIDEETVPRQEYLSNKLNYYYIPSPYGPHAFGGASLFKHIDYKPLSYGEATPASFYIFEAKYFNEYTTSHVNVSSQTGYWSYWGPYFRYAPSPSIMINHYYIINRIKKGSNYIVHSTSIKTASAIQETGNGVSSSINRQDIIAFMKGTYNTGSLALCVSNPDNYYILIGSNNCSLDGSFNLVCVPDPAPATTSDPAPQNLLVERFCKTSEGAEWLELSQIDE